MLSTRQNRTSMSGVAAAATAFTLAHPTQKIPPSSPPDLRPHRHNNHRHDVTNYPALLDDHHSVNSLSSVYHSSASSSSNSSSYSPSNQLCNQIDDDFLLTFPQQNNASLLFPPSSSSSQCINEKIYYDNNNKNNNNNLINNIIDGDYFDNNNDDNNNNNNVFNIDDELFNSPLIDSEALNEFLSNESNFRESTTTTTTPTHSSEFACLQDDVTSVAATPVIDQSDELMLLNTPTMRDGQNFFAHEMHAAPPHLLFADQQTQPISISDLNDATSQPPSQPQTIVYIVNNLNTTNSSLVDDHAINNAYIVNSNDNNNNNIIINSNVNAATNYNHKSQSQSILNNANNAAAAAQLANCIPIKILPKFAIPQKSQTKQTQLKNLSVGRRKQNLRRVDVIANDSFATSSLSSSLSSPSSSSSLVNCRVAQPHIDPLNSYLNDEEATAALEYKEDLAFMETCFKNFEQYDAEDDDNDVNYGGGVRGDGVELDAKPGNYKSLSPFFTDHSASASNASSVINFEDEFDENRLEKKRASNRDAAFRYRQKQKKKVGKDEMNYLNSLDKLKNAKRRLRKSRDMFKMISELIQQIIDK